MSHTHKVAALNTKVKEAKIIMAIMVKAIIVDAVVVAEIPMNHMMIIWSRINATKIIHKVVPTMFNA
jgi:hypothetical protein